MISVSSESLWSISLDRVESIKSSSHIFRSGEEESSTRNEMSGLWKREEQEKGFSP